MINYSNSDPIRIFIGYDPAETVAFFVLAHSIQVRAKQPVYIIPLNLRHLQEIFQRQRLPKQTTEFSISRFLVPYLCNYEGWALFMDCDMLCRADISELWLYRNWLSAVQVVKHNHIPNETTKFLNRPQTAYDKKNWSSMMIFNNERCRALTLDYVNNASGLELHQFKWLASEKEIGELPSEWNHLVGVDKTDPYAKLVHFTLGTPCFKEYANCEFANKWFEEKESMLFSEQVVVPLENRQIKKS